MYLQAVVSKYPIGGKILAFEVHVDRHVMFRAASTDRRHEVDRRNAAALLDERCGVWSDKQIHEVLSA